MKKDETILSWISRRRGLSKLELIPISKINNWINNDKQITNENNFYFSIIGVKVPMSEMSYWASLGEIQRIILQNNKTTNELRSVLSLLLKFL